jgi:hypothetical protein
MCSPVLFGMDTTVVYKTHRSWERAHFHGLRTNQHNQGPPRSVMPDMFLKESQPASQTVQYAHARRRMSRHWIGMHCMEHSTKLSSEPAKAHQK